MTTINAYITFDGNCREVMTFYKACLGGELTIQTVEGSPAEAHCPPAFKDQILHSSLLKDGLMLMGTDMAREGVIRGNNMALCMNCSSEEEINTFFSNLSAGGQVIEPLKVQFWGGVYGELVDKFKLRWMFNFDKNAK